ncbi:flagellar protein [Cohnella kolymensis]|uniref:Flagellar protein n=1 Tax=Cohnella kolymensis TaxID=1590652 RepID=A0ABR5A6H9_9BACL|nr:TIGR03826 family flagellar region protein [Cohnella kolymensis]KIL36691.1 flagellar protein [Cohnella kolymensis]
MNLGNCPRCGKLFAKNFRDVCGNCYQEIEKEYQKCADHLRKNRGITIQQLSDDTGSSVKQITRWIREGRITITNAPNMSYPCESCGIVLIRDGNLCDPCRGRLTRDIKNAEHSEKLQSSLDDNKPAGTYQIKRI